MRTKGYNLIEVIIAMGILAWVILAIAGLFSYGTRGVYSGKIQTKATALAQKVVEDMRNLSTRSDRYSIFGGADGDTTHTYDSRTAAATGNAYFDDIRQQWTDALTELPGYQATAASQAYVWCRVDAVDADPSATPTLKTCDFLSMDLQVHWQEGVRHRQVRFQFAF